MGERTLLGVIHPDNHTFHAVYYQWGDAFTTLLPKLRLAWHEKYHADITALAEALIDPGYGDDLRPGALDEVPGLHLVQLTLLHPDHPGISAYGRGRGRWELISRHPLTVTDEDLFTVTMDDCTGRWACTQCRAVDRLKFDSPAPAESAPDPGGQSTVTTCTGCGSTETVDADFTVTVRRVTAGTTPLA